MTNREQHLKAVMTGRRSRAAGGAWEELLGASCRHYRLKGAAEITKTPEPMKPIGPKNAKGQFLACYTKQAQPDYKGTLAGGRAVVFEAKHTDSDRLQRSVVSEEQEKQLDRHAALGADCFVMVSFGFRQFFKIPWEVFRDMKERYGRKYITPEDVQEYRVRYIGALSISCSGEEGGGVGIVVAIVISAVIAVAITIPWVNAIDKMKNDPEWQEHKDDPDYWEWP